MSRLLPGPRTTPLAPVRGRVLRFGDHVNTDLLHPSYFFSLDADTVQKGFLGAVQGKESASDSVRARVLLAPPCFVSQHLQPLKDPIRLRARDCVSAVVLLRLRRRARAAASQSLLQRLVQP